MHSLASLLVAAACVVGVATADAQAIPSTTTGVVYLRSDTIAYPPNYVPLSGLPGAEIGLSGNSTITNAAGTFSIPSSTTPTNTYSQLDARLPGFIPTFYPWLPEDAGHAIGIGVYPEVAVVPRPGFVAGIVPHDMGGWLPGVYAKGLFTPTFDRIKDVAAANLVMFPDVAFVTGYDIATKSVTIDAKPSSDAHFGMAPRSMYEDIVGQAKARNLSFMMMLGLYPGFSAGNFFADVGNVPITDAAFWDALFAAYRPLVLERTAIARDLGIEYVGLGFNLGFMSRLGPDRWRTLIEAMRAIGYTGKIAYFGGVNIDWGETEFNHYWDPVTGPNDPVGFARLFDVIGVDFYGGVTKATPEEVLEPAQTRARIRSSLKSILDRMSEAPVPIFAMVGTPSVYGGVTTNEYIEPCIVPACNSPAPGETRDYQQQADLYQALSEVINEFPVGKGRVMGLLSWGYHFRDDFTYGDLPGDSAYDKSANVRGKAAEAVLRWWFQHWTSGTRPENVAQPAIVAAWSMCPASADCASVVVFLDDGSYYHIQHSTGAQSPGGFDGYERGTYTWNAATQAFTVTTNKDTNGAFGLSGVNAVAGLKFVVAGNTGTLQIPGQSPIVVTRVTGADPIVGAWFASNEVAAPEVSVVVFLPNGTFLALEDGTPNGGGTPGIEHGQYIWAPEARAFVVNGPPGVDTNGAWGLWPSRHPSQTIRVSADLLTTTIAEQLRTRSVTRVGDAPAATPNFQGLWWNAPAGSESGWGINFAHQGDTLFATWFTYDASGKPMWMAASAQRSGPGVYTGDLFTTTGPAFSAVPFNPANVVENTVGTATFTFTDANNGTFSYTVNAATIAPGVVAQTKNITRQLFATPAPTCVWAEQPNLAQGVNYQDLWWKSPASSESGWGINLTHQGGTIFATWFTYDAAGKPWWLAFVANETALNVFTGDIFTTTGPAFNAVPFNGSTVVETTVGAVTLTFFDGNRADLAYTVNGVAQTKSITRQVFAAPGTLCSPG